MNKPRANEIDLLRFLAAIAVVLYHYVYLGSARQFSPLHYPGESVAKYGHFGVELFFLISGFVILMSAANGSVRQFAVSRVVRLFPAYWVCCSLTFFTVLFFGADKFTATVGQYLSNLTMLNSFGFMQKIAPYSYLDGSYWSLGVELRFYAFVAIILVLRQMHRAELFFATWLLASIIVEFANITALKGLLIVEYSAYFIAGAMLFLIWSRGFTILRAGVVLGAWLFGLYEARLSTLVYEANFHTEVNIFVVFVLLSSFFVVMGLIAAKRTGWIGRQNWMALGALTYPLYLIHQVIGYIIMNYAYPTINRHLLLWGAIVLMIGISYMVNVHVERRFAPVLKQRLTVWMNYCHKFIFGDGIKQAG